MNFLFTVIIIIIGLISGLAAFHDVFGYLGGHVEIFCYFQITGYFCKFQINRICENLLEAQVHEQRYVQEDRWTLFDSTASVALTFRNLKSQDTGRYQCGGSGNWRHDINLKVITDPCCSGMKMLQAHSGQTVTIDCSYPPEFASDFKTFNRLSGDHVTQLTYTIRESNQDGKFLLSEDPSRNVLSVSVRDVSEDDAGVYSCAVWRGDGSVGYYSHFTKVQLNVTAGNSVRMPGRPHISTGVFIIGIVCGCVTLLLIGGSILIYKWKCSKSRGSAPPQTGISLTDDCDYQNDPRQAPNSQSDATPRVNQSDSNYQPLRWNTNQPDQPYWILNLKQAGPAHRV